MKRLLFLLPLLLVSVVKAAPVNTVTPGAVKLLLPTTGYIDPTRRIDDKFNSNFKVIAATMNDILANEAAIGSSTGALNTAFRAYTATADVRMNGFSVQDATSDLKIAEIKQSTVDITAVLAEINLATTTLGSSTATLANELSADIYNRTYFLHSGKAGTLPQYLLALSTPSASAEVIRTQNVTSVTGLVKISSHVTADNDPGATKIPAGVWSFTTWASVSVAAGVTQIVITVSTVSSNGAVVTEILSSTSTNLLDTAVTRYDVAVVQQNDIFISTSDRVLVTYSGRTTSLTGTNVSLYFAGTLHYTHFSTPLTDVFKFTQLQDVPSSYTGQNGKYVAVKSDQTGLEFVNAPTGGGASAPRTFTFVVGTTTVNGADFDGFNGLSIAVSSAVIRGGGSIFIQDGIYHSTQNIVISSNIAVLCSKNAIFRKTAGGIENILTIQGQWTGGIFEPQAMATAGAGFVEISGDYSVFEDFTLRNGTNSADATWNYVKLIGNNAIVRNGLITGNTITGGSARVFGFASNATKNVQFLGNKIVGNAGAGNAVLLCSSTNSFTFQGNIIADNTWTLSILQVQRATGAIINSNTIDLSRNSGTAFVYMQTQSDGTNVTAMNIFGNTIISGTNPITIQTHDTAGYAQYINVAGNTFISPITNFMKIYRNASGTALSTYIHDNNIILGNYTSEDSASVGTHHRDNMVNGVMQTDD